MSKRHRHRFQRLSDEVLFCECGEVRFVTKPIGPYVPVPSITIDPIYPKPWIGPNIWPRFVPHTGTVTYPNDGRMMVIS